MGIFKKCHVVLAIYWVSYIYIGQPSGHSVFIASAQLVFESHWYYISYTASNTYSLYVLRIVLDYNLQRFKPNNQFGKLAMGQFDRKCVFIFDILEYDCY